MAAQAGIPRLEAPIVNPDGSVSIPWYRFFVQLWKLSGGATPLASGAYLVINGSGGFDIYDAATNTYLATIQTTASPGQPVVVEAPGVSPYTFTADASGTIVVFGAEVEMQRGAAGWKKASLTGGAFPLRKNDQIRVTWFTTDVPEVSWWPD